MDNVLPSSTPVHLDLHHKGVHARLALPHLSIARAFALLALPIYPPTVFCLSVFPLPLLSSSLLSPRLLSLHCPSFSSSSLSYLLQLSPFLPLSLHFFFASLPKIVLGCGRERIGTDRSCRIVRPGRRLAAL